MTLLSLGFFVSGLSELFPTLELTWFNSYGISVPPDVVAEGLTSLGFTPGTYAAYGIALVVIRAAVCYLIGALLFWRNSGERMALIVAVFLVALPSSDTDPTLLHALAAEQPVRATAGKIVEIIGFTLVLWMFFLFPDGRFRPRWTWLVALCWLLVGGATLLLPGSPLDALTWSVVFFPLFLFAALGAGIHAQVWRYRRVSGPIERQQTKWLALGLTALLGAFAGQSALGAVVPFIWQAGSPVQLVLADLGLVTISVVSFLAVPLTLAIAITRHRLFDIDIIINRALVYTLLTGLLLAVYLSGVVLLQAGFRATTSQTSEVAVIISTLVIAALFQPLRARLQGFIDRRFYRRKYDAARTLAVFSARLRDEVDLAALSDELARVVDETMRPSHVSLWVRPAGKRSDLS